MPFSWNSAGIGDKIGLRRALENEIEKEGGLLRGKGYKGRRLFTGGSGEERIRESHAVVATDRVGQRFLAALVRRMHAARSRSLKNAAGGRRVKSRIPPRQSPRVYKTGPYLLQNPVFQTRARDRQPHVPRERSVPPGAPDRRFRLRHGDQIRSIALEGKKKQNTKRKKR